MQRIAEFFHRRPIDDFHEGDHQEYVQNGLPDILLIGGAALLLIGGFAAVILG